MRYPELGKIVEGRQIIPEYEAMLEGLERAGIGGFLVDIDDTLIDTQEVFMRTVTDTVKNISERLSLSYDLVWRIFQRENMAAYNSHHVRPDRWKSVIRGVTKEFGCGGMIEDQIENLMRIYSIPPKWLPGARELLWAIRDVGGLKVAAVTNANEAWTKQKVRLTGVEDYIDELVIVDQNRHKCWLDWQLAARKLGLDVNSLVGIGDSVKSDIEPMVEAQLGVVVAIPSPVPHFRGVFPSGVIVAENIAAVPTVLAAYDPS